MERECGASATVPDALIEALHSAQEAFGYLDDDALRFIGESLLVPPSKVFGVATFYHYFTLKPAGEHTCVVCTGTACYINGAGDILAAIRAGLDVKARETTADGKLSLLTARCLGACRSRSRGSRRRRGRGAGQRPRVRGSIGGAVSESSSAAALERLRLRRVGNLPVFEGPARASAYVCEAVSCLSTQSHEVLVDFADQITDAGLTDVRGQAGWLPGPLCGRPAGADPGDWSTVRACSAR